MPYMKSAAAKATELSWDAFPEPTPDSDRWQPDPDSIPVAGYRPDPRFNKDPLTEKQKLALMRGRRFGVANSCSATSSGVSSPTTSISTSIGVGKWVVPAPRATGLPRACIPTINDNLHSSITTQHEAPHSVKAVHPAPKGITEAPLAPAPFQCPLAPAKSASSQRSQLPTKTATPEWARPLAHLLSESPPKPVSSCQPLLVQVRSATTPSTSTPPHLRKQAKSSCWTAAQTSPSKHQPGSLNKTNLESAHPEPTKATPVNKPANSKNLKQLAHHYNLTQTQRPTSADGVALRLGDELQVQKKLLESFIPKISDLSIQQHRRYLNRKLISLMEDEMDMRRRTTRKELQNMSEKELESHLARTTSMHRLACDDEQKNNRTCEADTKTVPVDLQQHDQYQFN
ncbi:uncharacterized protein EKO05_0004351 [Ascochyta rabiei]|uniref:Uncharacterized protein n=1 Tax=Didymella rabiei TaxID=5454 RepID=A0A162XR05_DIDRA|nr:uncharacterized protein EKO05_0004351 [Ascochyta rabiei]KZM19655.1 hypothetical protein ST47_g8979 [Ascochyta rabiei]UPX13854.1 hypothetical protein EKO05_0004351 [Ascochyta rabiei]